MLVKVSGFGISNPKVYLIAANSGLAATCQPEEFFYKFDGGQNYKSYFWLYIILLEASSCISDL